MKVSLEQAANLLNTGHVVAVPTETVYGLAARLDIPDAIEQIFMIKGRPRNNPLIVHIASSEQLSQYVLEVPPDLSELTKHFWPGPLTLILRANTLRIPDVVRAGLDTVAVRVPDHPLTRQLIEMTGPLVMPSANLSGRPSATTFGHVEHDFGVDFPVLDGGVCHQGVESTILFWDGASWSVVRLGALSPEQFQTILGYIPEVSVRKGSNGEVPICPGQMYRHYAPKAQLVLLTSIPKDTKGVIVGFEDRTYPKGCRLFSLGTSTQPEQAAKRLYGLLRDLDTEGVKRTYVDMHFPEAGLWRTLRERLYKASVDTTEDNTST